ncbi:hypothetical protein [Prevotella melaninogenica]|uniref:hypothetical protein n=1 Tax=Prevotella melaninogenica TaxID=28132 RepID=UPI000B093A1B|nr:hypothetical protein [Prevotella melaninogenica]
MSDDLFHLLGKFGISHLLSRLSLKKQDGVSASELLLSLCSFHNTVIVFFKLYKK